MFCQVDLRVPDDDGILAVTHFFAQNVLADDPERHHGTILPDQHLRVEGGPDGAPPGNRFFVIILTGIEGKRAFPGFDDGSLAGRLIGNLRPEMLGDGPEGDQGPVFVKDRGHI